MPEEGVVHPKHYNLHPSGIECIKIIQHHNYNIGAALNLSRLKDGRFLESKER